MFILNKLIITVPESNLLRDPEVGGGREAGWESLRKEMGGGSDLKERNVETLFLCT